MAKKIPSGSFNERADYLASLIYGRKDATYQQIKKKIVESLQSGNLSPEIGSIIKQVNPGASTSGFFESEFNRIKADELPYLKNPSKYLQDQLGQYKDSPDLTDDELNQKLEILNALGTEKRGEFNYSEPFRVDNIDPRGGTISDYSLQTGYQEVKPQSYEDEIKSIQDILSGRAEKRKKESDISAFLADAPEQQRLAREDYLSGLEENLQAEFEQERIPRDFQSLNTRGLLDSPGEVADALSTGAFDIQSTIEQARIELEQQDYQFFYDMAYQDQLRKSLDAAKDYQATLSSERDKLRVDQENRFQSTENAINRDFNFKLQDIQYKQQLNAQEIRAKRQRDAQESAKRSQLYSQAGSAAGAIGGAAVGGPPGAMVGASVGSGAGYLD